MLKPSFKLILRVPRLIENRHAIIPTLQTILRTFFEPELETRILPLKLSQVRSLKPAFCRYL